MSFVLRDVFQFNLHHKITYLPLHPKIKNSHEYSLLIITTRCSWVWQAGKSDVYHEEVESRISNQLLVETRNKLTTVWIVVVRMKNKRRSNTRSWQIKRKCHNNKSDMIYRHQKPKKTMRRIPNKTTWSLSKIEAMNNNKNANNSNDNKTIHGTSTSHPQP